MAFLNPTLISSNLLISNPLLNGTSWKLSTQAIALGVFNWLQTSVTANVLCTGTLGTGFATGKVIILPNYPLIKSAFSSNNVTGNISDGIITALSICFSTLPITFSGLSPIVGTGSCNIINVIAPYPTLLASLQTAFPACGCPNPNPLLLNAIALSLSNLFSTATGIGAIAGPPSILAGSSPTICKLG